ncbi:MAG: CBS domain-containing protein [Candidatus Aminicenantes bacterium]|nr:CBS domain-containing protein [Candidatus Aminicenantes bacterium]
MKVIKLAQVPPPSVKVDATVLSAAMSMRNARIGAAAVLEGDQLVGIFSERDVMVRVVVPRLDPEATTVRDVMTTAVQTVGEEAEAGEALELMVARHIRHLPVVNSENRVTGLLSVRNLLQHHIEELADQLNSLEAYFSADGPGG